jgi:hypothetical protein
VAVVVIGEVTYLDGSFRTGTFAVAGGGECLFIQLVNIGRNHFGDDGISIVEKPIGAGKRITPLSARVCVHIARGDGRTWSSWSQISIG